MGSVWLHLGRGGADGYVLGFAAAHCNDFGAQECKHSIYEGLQESAEPASIARDQVLSHGTGILPVPEPFAVLVAE